MSVKKWMDKEKVLYTFNGILFSHKKKNPAICYNINYDDILLAEISRIQKCISLTSSVIGKPKEKKTDLKRIREQHF